MASLWKKFKGSIRDSFRRARHFKVELKPLLIMMVIMVVTSVLSLIMYYLFGENVNASVVFVLAVMVVSCFTPGYFYSTLASVLGVLGVNFFFMGPYLGFSFIHAGYPTTFGLLFVTSYLTCTFMTIYRNQAEKARKNERITDALFRMSNELLSADEDAEVGRIVERWISSISGCPAHYVSGERAGEEKPHTLMLPVMVRGLIAGTFVVEAGQSTLDEDEINNILRLFAAQYAMVKEKQLVAAERNKVSLEMEAEKLRANLLRAVSHDLRTPLTSISGATSALIDSGETLSRADLDQLYSDIRDNAQWLIRMVENLLSVTRITQSPSAIHKVPELAEEVLAEAAGQIRRRFPGQKLTVRAPDEVLIVPMDATLVEQVIINLIENAIYHADASPIEVEVVRDGDNAIFRVRDHGDGVDKERMGRLFDGYAANPKASDDSHRGMGLGLSICASIVHAHRGEIHALNTAEGGALFSFKLPLEGTPQVSQDSLQ